MKNLTQIEKISVLRILTDIVNADNIVHKNEVAYMKEVAQSLGVGSNYEKEVNSLVTLKALSIVRELPAITKEQVAQLMGRMIVIDRDINYNEVRLYNEFCNQCHIEEEFHIEDYPGYTLSGPFETVEETENRDA